MNRLTKAKITRFSLMMLLFMGALFNGAFAQDVKPNIVIIIADDLGWNDVGYNGSEVKTPSLDELANAGMTLKRFYVNPSCTPTRASLMTGQAAPRLGITSPFMASSKHSLPTQIKILPEFLKDAGYQTALAGKWHLGHANEVSLPLARGFEQAYGFLTGGIGHWDHVSSGGFDWHKNQQVLREQGHATDLIAKESVRVIKKRRKDSPLFLYVSFSAPHLPNEAPEDFVAEYVDIPDPNRRIHAAMVTHLDQAVGKVVAALAEENILDNTLIWFFSDNGGANKKYARPGRVSFANFISDNLGTPAPTKLLELLRSNTLDGGSDNGPYRGGKGAVYEGGVLVPSFIHWPQKLEPRSLERRVTINDLLPTLARVSGATIPSDHILDGEDVSNILQNSPSGHPVDFIVESLDLTAYFSGDFKLVHDGDELLELYNLREDPFEQNNIAGKHAALVAEMLEKSAVFPRAEPMSMSMWDLLIDPESWGGEEYKEPWLETVE